MARILARRYTRGEILKIIFHRPVPAGYARFSTGNDACIPTCIYVRAGYILAEDRVNVVQCSLMSFKIANAILPRRIVAFRLRPAYIFALLCNVAEERERAVLKNFLLSQIKGKGNTSRSRFIALLYICYNVKTFGLPNINGEIYGEAY